VFVLQALTVSLIRINAKSPYHLSTSQKNELELSLRYINLLLPVEQSSSASTSISSSAQSALLHHVIEELSSLFLTIDTYHHHHHDITTTNPGTMEKTSEVLSNISSTLDLFRISGVMRCTKMKSDEDIELNNTHSQTYRLLLKSLNVNNGFNYPPAPVRLGLIPMDELIQLSISMNARYGYWTQWTDYINHIHRVMLITCHHFYQNQDLASMILYRCIHGSSSRSNNSSHDNLIGLDDALHRVVVSVYRSNRRPVDDIIGNAILDGACLCRCLQSISIDIITELNDHRHHHHHQSINNVIHGIDIIRNQCSEFKVISSVKEELIGKYTKIFELNKLEYLQIRIDDYNNEDNDKKNDDADNKYYDNVDNNEYFLMNLQLLKKNIEDILIMKQLICRGIKKTIFDFHIYKNMIEIMNTYLQLFTGINTTTDNYNSSNDDGNSNGHFNDDSHHSNEILRKHRLNIFYYNDNELELQHVFLKVLKSYHHNHGISSSSINFSTYLIQLQVILLHMSNHSMKSLIERLDEVIKVYDTMYDILFNALRDVNYLINQIGQKIAMRKITYNYGGRNTNSSYGNGNDTYDDVAVNIDSVKKDHINDNDIIGDALFESIADAVSDDRGDVSTLYLKTCKVLYDVKYSYDEVREKLWLIADDCIILPSIFEEIERVLYFILDKSLKNMNGLVSRYKQNIKSKIDQKMMHLHNMTMTTDANSSSSSSSSDIDATSSSSSGIKGWWNQLTETWLICSFSDTCTKSINIETFDGKGDGGGNGNGNDGKSMGLIRSSIQNALYPNMKVELIEESIITTLLEIEPLIQDLILSSSTSSSSSSATIATHRLQSTHDHIELLLCKVMLYSPNSKILSTYIHQDTYHHNRAIQALSKHWLHLEHEVMKYHHLSTQELENLNNILITKGTINHDIGLINVIDYIITNKLVSSSIQNTINTIQQVISYRNGLYTSIQHSITILKQLYHRAKHTEEFLIVGIHRIRVGKKFISNQININKDNINNNNNEVTKDKLNNMERLMKAILVKQQHNYNNNYKNGNNNDDNNEIVDHKEYNSPSKDSLISSPNYKRIPPFNPDSHPSERIFRPQPSTSSHNQQGSIFPRSS
jgi:hypothetical protein